MVSLALADGRQLLWAKSPAVRERLWDVPGADHGEHAVDPVLLSQRDWSLGSGSGWEVMAPNAGEPGRIGPLDYPFHGSAGRGEWEVSETRASYAVLQREDPMLGFRFDRRLELGPTHCLVDESLTNVSAEARAAAWGSHLAFGQDMLDGGCELELPGEVLAGTLDGRTRTPVELAAWLARPTEGSAALVFLGCEPGTQVASVRNQSQGVVARVSWDAAVFPYLWVWVELGGTQGWPWFGAVRALGVEPLSSWPDVGVAQLRQLNGTQVELAAGQRLVGQVRLEVSTFSAGPRR